MASSRERMSFNTKRMKIKNKWEVVLVLVVIAAGIVITTVAAIKAKEKRQMILVDGTKTQPKTLSNPTVNEISDVTTESVNIKLATVSSNRRPIHDPRKSKLENHFTPDYDVEYDVVKSPNDEYTALASETFDNSNNAVMLQHDGLPGYAPPKGALASTQYNSKAELAAEAAGFVLETQSMGESAETPLQRQPEFVPFEVKNDPQVNHGMQNNANSPKAAQIASPHPSSFPKIDLKRVPVFADPLMELVSHDRDSVRRSNPPPNDKRVNGRVSFKIVENRTPQQQQQQQQQQNSGPRNQIAQHQSPSIESAIRFLGMADEIALQSGVSGLSIPLRTVLMQNRKKRSVNSFENHDNPKIQTNNKVSNDKGLPFLLVHHIIRNLKNQTDAESLVKPKRGKMLHNALDENVGDLKTSPSNYFSFNDDMQFRNREDNDDENDGDTEDDQSSGSLTPQFNYDDISNRFSPLSSGRHHQSSNAKQNYYSGESRKHQKYGILGSGNFEIIRGGIYSDDESASNNVPNYVRKNNHRNHEAKSPHYEHQRHHEDDLNEDVHNNNHYGRYNDEFFSGNPVLGFQGYDNFGAATLGKQNSPKISQRRHGTEYYSGHYINHDHPYSHHASDSNLVAISSYKDLDATS